MLAEYEKEEAIFRAAIKRKVAADRAAYLREACHGDADLLSRVESLLRAHDDAGDFLDGPLIETDITLDISPLTEGPGTVIGRYKLLEKIGEGGMAVVYMAEQEQPIRRKVALKIIKLGMDTKQVIARFEAERQVLAMMDHPSIAKVLDAGATETGRPYFVMELVSGASITEYCDRNTMSTRGRLTLFLQICQVVQHAHSKGIIHRDIKPSNVMVTHHDGQPVPKVIDFGIAKVTNQRLTEKTLLTRYAHIIGTPAYMSPEQAEFGAAEVDFRTDVYSLAVLLYELLTGTTPFGEQRLREAGYAQMQRIIGTEEPTRPSSKIQTSDAAVAVVAARRGTTPGTLRRLLRHDLDWILMKGLEKDRGRRYATAGELAADVQRYLKHEPVQAAAPSMSYRISKFARRHRLAAAMVALATGATLMGATVARFTVWGSGNLPGTVEHATGMGQRHVWSLPSTSSLSGGTSLDGRYLSYVDWTAGNLAVRDLVTDANWLLTDNTGWKNIDGWAESAATAPDGKRIAYSWYNEKGLKFYDLRLVDLDGGNMCVLYHDAAVFWVKPYAWSPDGGNVLAYISDAEASLVNEETGQQLRKGRLVLVSAADGSIRVIKTPYNDFYPKMAVFSPDGRYVAYDLEQRDDPNHRDIFMIDLETDQEIALIEHAADDRVFGWTPDGRRIVFVSDRSFRCGLWMIEITDGAPRGEARMLVDQFDGWPIGFTAEGSLYYGVDTTASNVCIARLDSTGSSFEGEPELVSSQFVGSTTMADWSPDGNSLAYRAGRAGRRASGIGPGDWVFVVYSVETSRERIVRQTPSFVPDWPMSGPRWSPDGQSLLVSGKAYDGGLGLYTISSETGIPALIVDIDAPFIMRDPVWSPDGTSIYTRSVENLRRLDLATGVETELCNARGVRALDVSPDGKWLAFYGGQDSLMIMSSAGGELRKVIQLDEEELSRFLYAFVRWTPDGEHLLLSKRNNELWKVRAETGEQQQIGRTVGKLVDAAVHPDGRQIALTIEQDSEGRGDSSLWVIENFLPE